MMKIVSLVRFTRDCSGVAAVEFGMLLPVFALVCVGAIDFGLAFDAKLQLATAVGEGGQFAFLSGATVQPSQVETVVQNATNLSPISVSVTYNAASCYCPSGSPPTLAAQSCGSSCSSGAPAGKYVVINATYRYPAIFPTYALLANPVITETVTTRVQ